MTFVMQIGAILVRFPKKESRNLTFSYMLYLDQVVHTMLNESIQHGNNFEDPTTCQDIGGIAVLWALEEAFESFCTGPAPPQL